MLDTPQDIPVWYERWDDRRDRRGLDRRWCFRVCRDTTPQSFADKLQATVDEQLATPLE